ncbi:MAG: GIY-YIG nuclease family protein [Burkholderiaceae bacterium]|nr:GIY-YIG nuclease family protein [Burkholderiaceae bacterium]
MTSLLLHHLLTPFGFEGDPHTRLVRHQDKRYDVLELIRAGQFEFYQSLQSRPVFRGVSQIVAFVGQEGTHARFLGIYRVGREEGPADWPLPDGYIYPSMSTAQHFRYELVRDDRFDGLRNRLVIDWGLGTRSWVQHYRGGERPVIELLPAGYVREFPGYLHVVLRHDELVDIIRNPVAHRAWHRALAGAAGVYLILDTRTGRQYVGSAYGESGLLGRWRTYSESVHGGNEQLRALVAERPDVARDLQFSILQTVPVTLPAKEVIGLEVLHKVKLGSRAHGLNSN